MVFLQSSRLSNKGNVFNAYCDSVNVTPWELLRNVLKHRSVNMSKSLLSTADTCSERDSSEYDSLDGLLVKNTVTERLAQKKANSLGSKNCGPSGT